MKFPAPVNAHPKGIIILFVFWSKEFYPVLRLFKLFQLCFIGYAHVSHDFHLLWLSCSNTLSRLHDWRACSVPPLRKKHIVALQPLVFSKCLNGMVLFPVGLPLFFYCLNVKLSICHKE